MVQVSVVHKIVAVGFSWPVYIFNGDISRFLTAKEMVDLAWKNSRYNQELAIAYMSGAMKLLPDEPYTVNQCSLIYVSMAKYQEALRCMDRAIELMPQNYLFYLGRGNIRMLSGDFDGARESVMSAIKLAQEEITKALCWFELGVMALQEKL